MTRTNLSLTDLAEPKRITKTNDFYDCPFCTDSRARLGVLREKGIFHCFNCNASGRLRDLPSLERFDQKVAHRLQVNRPTDSGTGSLVSLPQGYKLVHKGSLAMRYLERRGITYDEITQFEIGYTPMGIFAQRIIIPIRKGGLVRYFVGRTYLNDHPKYMNAAAPKDDLVFKTFEGKVKEAVVCEGIFDALAINRVTPAISILGKTVTDKQVETVKRIADKAIVMLDSDAKIDGFKLVEKLKYVMQARLVFIPEKDPGEMTTRQIKGVLHANTGVL